MMGNLTRRLATFLNFIIVVILIGMLFILVNYVSSRRFGRWDLTSQKLSSLSDQTIQTLKSTDEPISIIVFYQPIHPLYVLVRNLLDEYERIKPNIRIEYVDPEQDLARTRQIVQELEIEELNLVVFQSSSRHKYVTDDELAEYDYSTAIMGQEPRVKAFTGEQAFTSAILSITQTRQPLVWFTAGHGEKSINLDTPDGLSDLKRALEQLNMRLEEVALPEYAQIPNDVALVAIIGPMRRFAEAEINLLKSYAQEGGKILIFLDPLTQSGLNDMLSEWGIKLAKDIVVDPAIRIPFVSAANLIIVNYALHPIVEKIQRQRTPMTLFPLARSVSIEDPIPQGISLSALALTSSNGWGEMETGTAEFVFTEGTDLEGPVSIAVAAEREEPALTRLVVIGDADFVTNGKLANGWNRDLVLGSVNWLVEQEQLISIGPKSLKAERLSLTAKQLMGIFIFGFLGMPLFCGILGLCMWWRRRK